MTALPRRGDVVQLHPAEERYLRPSAFCDELAQRFGIKAPSERWLRYRIAEGMPSRKVLKRYRMIPVEPALTWLRDKDFIP